MATIKNIHDYTDIIEVPYEKSTKYKHMTPRERAAQFAPFAALTGHKDLIRETERITEEKRIIDENKRILLDQKLKYYLKTKETIKITYFKKDKVKSGGCYLTIEQSIKKIDEIYKTITLSNQQMISIGDIYDLEEK